MTIRRSLPPAGACPALVLALYLALFLGFTVTGCVQQAPVAQQMPVAQQVPAVQQPAAPKAPAAPRAAEPVPVVPALVEDSSSGQAQAQSPAAPAADLPDRPEKIEFAPLAYEPPESARFRRTLPDGTVVYLAPSREFPLVNLSITFKGGASLDPADIPGLAAMTAALLAVTNGKGKGGMGGKSGGKGTAFNGE